MPQYLGLNISDSIAEAIAERIARTKESKTAIVVTALEKELGLEDTQAPIDRILALEVKVDLIKRTLETRIESIERILDAL